MSIEKYQEALRVAEGTEIDRVLLHAVADLTLSRKDLEDLEELAALKRGEGM